MLESAGIRSAPSVIITTHDDDTNIYLTIYCRRLRPDMQIISRATLGRNVGILHSAGADLVLSLVSMMSDAIINLLSPGRVFMLSEGLNLFRVGVGRKLLGRSLASSDIRRDTGCSVVAIRGREGQMLINPDPLREFQAGDDLYLIGDSGAESAFYERYGYEDCANRQMCEPWSVRRALIDGGADWAAEAFSDMAEKAASGPMSASVLPERESQREGHDVSRKKGRRQATGECVMNERERKALRAWMEEEGLRALMARIFELGEIGMTDADDEVPGPRGRTRLALDDADGRARDRLAAWMRELDLEVRVDAVGNMFGVLPAAPGGEGLAPLMIGSHIDTVGNAGPLDGVYGVLGGLTVLRAFRAADALPPRPLMVAAFTNEEGVRYQPDMMGSLVYAGAYPLEKALDTRGIDGSRLGDELERIGYAGNLPPGHVTPFGLSGTSCGAGAGSGS